MEWYLLASLILLKNGVILTCELFLQNLVHISKLCLLTKGKTYVEYRLEQNRKLTTHSNFCAGFDKPDKLTNHSVAGTKTYWK